jgi:two-component system phosphate regulon sensor histidine kinase PhoR
MFWIAPRTLLAAVVTASGAALGQWAGAKWEYALLGAGLGASLAGGALTLWDSWRGGRLLHWLSGSLDTAPPALTGLWGEMATRIERALRQRDRELRAEGDRRSQFLAAIEASPNGVLLLDATEQIEWCNGLAAQHLGLDPQRDLRQRITNLVRSPAFVDYLQSRRFDQPVHIPGPQGRGLLSVLVRPYGDGQRLLLTQDITERERVDATRRDFVANVSHEIRTPLTVLSGFVETMATLPLTESERARVLVLMGQQTRRMQSLVGDLLTLAGLEGSAPPPLDSWVPMARVAQAVEADAKGLSAGRHQFVFSWGHDASLSGNEGELVSAVGNLVNNAVRYTPEGGQIRVDWHRRDDGSAELAVRDTGPGIAPEHLPRLAERFYRVDGSRSRDTGGTGLGLAIVKHVAQRHGGELLIGSDLGRGSTFTLVFPPARVREARSEAVMVATQGPAQG